MTPTNLSLARAWTSNQADVSARQDTGNTCLLCREPFTAAQPDVTVYLWLPEIDMETKMHDACLYSFLLQINARGIN